MGKNRPVKTKDWLKFLKAHGCKKKRTTASHDLWDCPDCLRPITHRELSKEIPALHLKTNLLTMGLTLEYLYKWIQDNC